MSTTSIGFLSFHENPREGVAPMRFRALQAEAVLQGASFVVLDWADFDEVSGQVLIWSWAPAGWKGERGPLPDVMIVAGAPVNKQQARLRRWIFDSRPCICDVGIKKKDLTNIFRETPCSKYLIPDTNIPNEGGGEVIADFLTRHGSAVIKRSNANRGIGLIFVIKEGDGWYISDIKDRVYNISGIVDVILNRIKGRQAYRIFVIQKYIRSIATDGRAADIRVHVQRGPDHRWGITRAYVRLAEVGSMKTNVSCGGYQGPLMGYLQLRQTRSALDIKSELYDAAIDIAEFQSALSPRPLSELGIDFLLDTEDKIWLVETNAMPQSALHEHERAINTIGYALTFAGTTPTPMNE